MKCFKRSRSVCDFPAAKGIIHYADRFAHIRIVDHKWRRESKDIVTCNPDQEATLAAGILNGLWQGFEFEPGKQSFAGHSIHFVRVTIGK